MNIGSKKTLGILFTGLSLSLTALPFSGYAHLPATTTDGKSTVTSLAPMLQKATPAVVNISVEQEIPNPTAKNKEAVDSSADSQQAPLKSIGVGSGVIIDAAKGYIVTNAHIVRNQKVILVTLKDGRRYRGTLIGQTKGFDIAVIQIHANHLTVMPLGNSSKVNVGDFVVAVGSPFGLSQTVTSGVVSALNRSTPKIEGFQNFIQTDAPINPGNSGGALINMQGQFVGMNTAILAPSAGNIGIGFAIPSNMVDTVAQQLIKYGKVTPGLLGVIAQNLTPELAEAMDLKSDQGVVITEVVDNSPADEAGLKSEDVITKVDNTLINDSAQLHNLMGVTHPGTKIAVTVTRDGVEKALHATVGSPTAQVKQRIIPYLSGLRLQNFSDLEPNSKLIKGALVLDVTDTSAGALAGLVPGDIIVKANNHEIHSVKELITTANQAKKSLLLKVVRNNMNVFLVIQADH
ncbi:MAG: endopeptidase [Coxiella sp. RIFCSPHIGHO2_12_FULL_42_15]|nr:MAG: endopeptidase [Coxiella sp. RIFCSPHIGHO2_12_FULL_42_15]